MSGSTHSLPFKTRTRIKRQRRACAERGDLRRCWSQASAIAAIRHDFAHRFALAMREVCADTRSAMIQRLRLEQEAALASVFANQHAEKDLLRAAREASRAVCRRLRDASEFTEVPVTHRRPSRPRRRFHGVKLRASPTT